MITFYRLRHCTHRSWSLFAVPCWGERTNVGKSSPTRGAAGWVNDRKQRLAGQPWGAGLGLRPRLLRFPGLWGSHVRNEQALVFSPVQGRVFCPALTNYIGVCLAFSSFHSFVHFWDVKMLISIAFFFLTHLSLAVPVGISAAPLSETKPSGEGAGGQEGDLFPSLSCSFCNPRHTVRGSSGPCVQQWFADKRWSIGEELGCPCWEVLKRNRHPVSDCAWNLVLIEGEKNLQERHAKSARVAGCEGWAFWRAGC